MSTATVSAPQSALSRAAAQFEKLSTRLAEVEAAISATNEQEQEARLATLSEFRRSDGITDDVAKAQRKLEKLETERRGLLADIPIAQEVLRAERVKADGKLLDENGKAAKQIAAGQLELWREAGEKFGELHALFLRIIDEAERQDRFYQEVRHSDLLTSDESIAAWREISRLPVQPLPVDIREFLNVLVDVTCDPYGYGYRQPDGRASDDQRVLPSLLPDLRAANRNAELSGNAAGRASTTVAARGVQPVRR